MEFDTDPVEDGGLAANDPATDVAAMIAKAQNPQWYRFLPRRLFVRILTFHIRFRTFMAKPLSVLSQQYDCVNYYGKNGTGEQLHVRVGAVWRWGIGGWAREQVG